MPANSRDYNFFGAWPKNMNTNNHNNTNYNNNNNNHINMNNKNFLSRTSPSTPVNSPTNSRHNSPPASYPSSPISTSPPSTPQNGLGSLRRTYSSTFTLIPEDREIDFVSTSRRELNVPNYHQQKPTIDTWKVTLIRMAMWWPILILRIGILIFGQILGFVFLPLSFAAPSFWFSALLWVFWKIIRLPISIVSTIINKSNQNSGTNGKQRTVLISCGSTIQTLHLARNFHSSGTKVIVFEFEGLFGLARFSAAVDKFYTVPKPLIDSPQDYITALCEIVEKEKPTYYIPVCATSPAYFDALAKPHLELLGCKSFIPGLQENCVLDDTYEMFKECQANNIMVPQYRVLTNKEDLFSLYSGGWLSGYRNLMVATGLQGLLERHKFILPSNRRDLKLNHEVSEHNKWIVIRNVPGNHYITCTTVKESKLIANVTCLVDQETKNLMPESNDQIEKWLTDFFNKVRLQRPINGHISFRFIKCATTGELYPLGSRVGVSLPYICYTGVHSRVLWKPCPHFSRANSGPLIQDEGRYWISDAILSTIRNPTVNAFGKLINTVLDKREALFSFSDPLPYVAYYNFQLPLKSVKDFVQKRQAARTNQIAAAPVH